MEDIEELITDLREVFAPMVRELCADDKFDCDELCAGNIMTSECIIFRAASALKRLCAENERLREGLAAELAKTKKLVDSTADLLLARDRLQAHLAESQRRTRAAVEDMAQDAHCVLCKHHRSNGGDCIGVSMCAVDGKRIGWEWRGPQEVGEGETE